VILPQLLVCIHALSGARGPIHSTMSGKGWWNSAISGLESKLDTILAEDAQASAKAKAADGAAKQESPEKAVVDKKLVVEPGGWDSK
jgi:hypothetical protein